MIIARKSTLIAMVTIAKLNEVERGMPVLQRLVVQHWIEPLRPKVLLLPDIHLGIAPRVTNEALNTLTVTF
jgi:hypothetical protein